MITFHPSLTFKLQSFKTTQATIITPLNQNYRLQRCYEFVNNKSLQKNTDINIHHIIILWLTVILRASNGPITVFYYSLMAIPVLKRYRDDALWPYIVAPISHNGSIFIVFLSVKRLYQSDSCVFTRCFYRDNVFWKSYLTGNIRRLNFWKRGLLFCLTEYPTLKSKQKTIPHKYY